MRERVQQHVRPTRERALALPVHSPVLVSMRKRIEALLHGWSFKPLFHCLRPKLNEQPLTAVLDRRKPRWIKGDLRAFDIGLIFTIDIRCHCLEACEAHQGENLAQAVDLNYR